MTRRSQSDLEHNRRFWDADAGDYQAAHHDDLAARPLAWGAFRIPETELGVLGDVRGLDVLELGCGGGQWSVALAGTGAAICGLDVSASQLRHAAAHARTQGAKVPLVQASGDTLPFAARSFDVVFCDHGAMSFCDPALTVPEVARVLRPGGRLAFCAAAPLIYLTWNAGQDKQSRRLHQDYDDLGRITFDEGTVDWVLPPGEFIRLFRTHGFDIEALVELRPPKGATTTYVDYVDVKWARRWPAEWIWTVRKR